MVRFSQAYTRFLRFTNGNLQIVPEGITQIGDAGSTSHSLAANDDLFVSGKFECDGAAYFDAGATVATSLVFSGGADCVFGSGKFYKTNSYYLYGLVDDGAHICVDEDSITGGNNNLIISNYDNLYRDHDHTPGSANPTLIIHSATNVDSDNTQWVSFAHNQTDAEISTGKGNVELKPVAGSYVVLSSSKGSTGDPTGKEGMIYINTTDNVVKIYADGAWRTLASW